MLDHKIASGSPQKVALYALLWLNCSRKTHSLCPALTAPNGFVKLLMLAQLTIPRVSLQFSTDSFPPWTHGRYFSSAYGSKVIKLGTYGETAHVDSRRDNEDIIKEGALSDVGT